MAKKRTGRGIQKDENSTLSYTKNGKRGRRRNFYSLLTNFEREVQKEEIGRRNTVAAKGASLVSKRVVAVKREMLCT